MNNCLCQRMGMAETTVSDMDVSFFTGTFLDCQLPFSRFGENRLAAFFFSAGIAFQQF